MEFKFNDLLAIFLITLCVATAATKNSPSVSIPSSTSWSTRTSATKRKITQSAESKDALLANNVNESIAKSCPLDKGVLELGKTISLDDCGRLECVEEATGLLTLAEVRCLPPNERISLECQWALTAVTRFPECCIAAITCERSRKPYKEEVLSVASVTKIPFQTKPSSSIHPFLSTKSEMLDPMHSASSNVNVLVVERNDRGTETFRNNFHRLKESKTDVLYDNNNSTTTVARCKKRARTKIRGNDYKKFIERAKNLLKTNSSDPKPSFYLPIRRRKTPSIEAMATIQVTNGMFVTNDSTEQTKVLQQESKIPDSLYARRRLSSLLSDPSLRGRLADKFVPIIAATSDQQKSFIFSKINQKPNNDSVTENSDQIKVTSSTGPPKIRSRKPHWHLDPQKQGRNFESHRKLFSSRLHKFTNRKPEKNTVQEVATLSAGKKIEESEQTTIRSSDIVATVESVVNFSVTPRVNSALTENSNGETNKIEKESADNKFGTHEGVNNLNKTRERIKVRRKIMRIPNYGNVRDKRLLEMLSYELKRKNSTDDVAEKSSNESATTEIFSFENRSAKPEQVLVNSTTKHNLSYHQRRRMGPKERLFLHIKPLNRTRSRIAAGSKIIEIKKDLTNNSTVATNASEIKLETATETAKVNQSRTFNKISIPVFRLKDLKSEENKAISSRGKIAFDLSKRKGLSDLASTAEMPEKRVASRGRTLQTGESEENNETKKISENGIESTKATDTNPPLPPHQEEDYVLFEEPPPGYDPTTDPDYPKITPMKSSLEDFDRYYPLSDEDNHKNFYDLDLSSSDADISQPLGQEGNEIRDEDTKIPMKVTTVVISQSQKSYRSSVSRDTAKNFKETPIYESKTFYKNVKKPVPHA